MPSLPDELETSVIKTGNGQSLAAGDKMRIHYACALSFEALLNGDYVDNSEWHSSPIVVTVGSNELLDGLGRALVGVSLGDTLRVKVPPSLAFGARGVPGRVPPDTALYFQVEISTPPDSHSSRR